jgi:anti-sigma factor RsiW
MDEQKKLQACPKFEAVLEDYTSEALSGAEKEGVAAHLQTCAGCAAAVHSTLRGRAFLRMSAEAVEDPGPFFTRRVMTRIRALEERNAAEKSFWKPLEVLAMRTVWASAAAITLLVAYVNIAGTPARHPVAEVRSADQGGLFVDPSSAIMTRDDALITITDTHNGQQ